MKIAAIIPKIPQHWDDHDTAVVLLAGCNFSCAHCFVPELVKDAESIERMPMKRAFEILFSQPNTGRVVITGGEPLVQGQKLAEFLETLKNGGFKVKLETNGSDPEVLEHLIQEELVDFVTLDIKHRLNDTAYEEIAGTLHMASAVKKSIRILRKSRLPFEFSFTVVPWQHTQEDIEEVGRTLRGKERMVLQSFISGTNLMTEEFQNCPTPTVEMMELLAQVVAPYFPEVKVVHPQKKWIVSLNEKSIVQ